MNDIQEAAKVLREKLANQTMDAVIPASFAGGITGGSAGGLYGSLAGLGYGVAKGRPVAGTARGALRGVTTGTGVGIGGALGGLAGSAVSDNPLLAALTALGGAAAGGYGGWKLSDKIMGKKMKEKEGRDPSVDAFSSAVQNVSNSNLQSTALNDVGRIGITGLGVGLAGRGLLGLVQSLRERGRKKLRSGPTYLPLPYLAKAGSAVGSFLQGNDATSSAGIPWYGPAAVLGGIAGLGVGWHGMDKLLNARRQQEMENDLDAAKEDFTKAMLAQYREPIKVHPEKLKNASDDSVMVKLGETLDRLFEKLNTIHAEKTALDVPDLAGQAAGGYGVYAGLSGLLTGALIYDRMRKRSRQAVLDKAIQMRQRRRAALAPNTIYAIPEPVSAAG